MERRALRAAGGGGRSRCRLDSGAVRGGRAPGCGRRGAAGSVDGVATVQIGRGARVHAQRAARSRGRRVPDSCGQAVVCESSATSVEDGCWLTAVAQKFSLAGPSSTASQRPGGQGPHRGRRRPGRCRCRTTLRTGCPSRWRATGGSTRGSAAPLAFGDIGVHWCDLMEAPAIASPGSSPAWVTRRPPPGGVRLGRRRYRGRRHARLSRTRGPAARS